MDEEKKYPVHLSVPYPAQSSRLLAFFSVLFFVPKALLLVPHFIVLWFLGMAAAVAIILAQVFVLFRGYYPRVLFDFVVGVYRWQLRVNAFFLGLTDEYPPFRLGE